MKLGKKRMAVGLPAIKNAGFLLVILLPFVLLYEYCSAMSPDCEPPYRVKQFIIEDTEEGQVARIIYEVKWIPGIPFIRKGRWAHKSWHVHLKYQSLEMQRRQQTPHARRTHAPALRPPPAETALLE